MNTDITTELPFQLGTPISQLKDQIIKLPEGMHWKSGTVLDIYEYFGPLEKLSGLLIHSAILCFYEENLFMVDLQFKGNKLTTLNAFLENHDQSFPDAIHIMTYYIENKDRTSLTYRDGIHKSPNWRVSLEIPSFTAFLWLVFSLY